MNIAIHTHELSKTYQLGFLKNRTVRALQGLSLNIEEGQVYGLLGPNGAGKSTTIKILMNLVRPTAGEARIFGLAPSNTPGRAQIGFLPENPAPYEYLTGREFVTLAGRLSGMRGADLTRRVTEVLQQVDMAHAAHLIIRQYSKGIIQRVALAQALVHRPRLLILDEPTSGLDPIGRRQMRDIMLSERGRGTTILFCTHVIPDVEAVCDRVAVLVGSRLVREGRVTDLLSAQTQDVEVVVEGLAADVVQGFVQQVQVQQLADRVLLKLGPAQVGPLLSAVLAKGGRIAQVTPSRFSLEDLFLEAVHQARAGKSGVGGDLQ